MWRHFQTLFVLQRPFYASVYPPVQGAMIALGLKLANEPWIGVLVGMALMCVAVIWMLRAYVPHTWALYGGLLTGAGFGILSYWVNSYWGGAGAAIGGALVFGAWPRVASQGRTRDAVILGAGMIVLANSRPFEGLLASLPVLAMFLCQCVRKPRYGAAAFGVVVLAGAILTASYYWRVTGSPFQPPHVAYMSQYAATPAFVWQSPTKAPDYDDWILRDAHWSFGIDYTEYSTIRDAVAKSFRKLSRLATFYWGPLWVLVLLTLPEFIREPKYRLPLLSLAFCLAGILQTIGFQVHYAAPCTAVFILLLVESLRRVRSQWKRLGSALAIAAPVAWLGFQMLEHRGPPQSNSLYQRPAVLAKIAGNPGQHLVFVHYGRQHPLGEEWVYNEPDLDRAKVLWARDLGLEKNRELAHYFPDRTIWLVEPDQPVVKVAGCKPTPCLQADDQPIY